VSEPLSGASAVKANVRDPNGLLLDFGGDLRDRDWRFQGGTINSSEKSVLILTVWNGFEIVKR
jgi:hypothetical protein